LNNIKFDSKSEPIHYKPKEKIQSEKGWIQRKHPLLI
jgi:hypothetical protein